MDVHDSPGTTNDSKDQDIALLPSCSRFKRAPPLPIEAKQYETVRKITHLQEQPTTDRKQPESIDQQSLPIFEISSFEGRPNYSESICSTPLRQKYAHLIPEYQRVEYNLEQRTLVRIQSRLDQHLIYLKTHRGRKHGEFFKIIRRNLIEGVQLIVELSHLKQILFIDSQLYICNHERSRDLTLDVLIDIPTLSDLTTRKAGFRQKLFEYLRLKGAFETGRKNTVPIPTIKFAFQEKIQSSNQLILNKRAETALDQSQKTKQTQKQKVSLKNMISKTSNLYKDMLYQKIQEKENRMLEQAKLNEGKRRFGKEDVLKVMDEILLVYTSKKICNMFRGTLTDQISKQLTMSEIVAVEVIQFMLEQCSAFLRKVEHAKGPILQMDRKAYAQVRAAIQLLEI